MILEKFGFITDEISAKEDRAWSTGPSGAQFLDYVHTFENFAASTPSISIQAASSTLLFQLKVPLGFRTYDGDLEFEEIERVASKYIRAELNVLLRRKHLAGQRTHQRWRMLSPVLELLKRHVPGPQQRFINGVEFTELTKVLVYWRKPSLTPDHVKISRKDIIEEVIVMSCALTIFEFFRRLVAIKRRRETAALLSDRLLLSRWMRSDRHYIRRQEHYRAVSAELSETARARRTTVSRLEWPATVQFPLVLEPHQDVNGLTLVSHVEAVSSQKFKVLRPKHGLDALRRGANNGFVVVCFVDSVHKALGSWRVDMRGWGWEGWSTFPTDGDAFLRPARVSPNREPASWTELVLRMSGTNTEELQNDGQGREQMDGCWTVLDVQSFLEEVEETESSGAVRNVVRMHIAHPASMDTTEQRETQTSAVVEIIGYIQVGPEDASQ